MTDGDHRTGRSRRRASRREAQTAPPTLFVYSAKNRDGLTADLSAIGHSVIAARRAEGLASRLLGSGAPLAIVDMRGGGLAASRALKVAGTVVADNGLALIAIVDREETALIAGLARSDATHMIVAPFGNEELRTTVALALRLAERVAVTAARQPRRWAMALGAAMELDSELERAIDPSLLPLYPRSALYRELPSEARRGARDCWRRAGRSGGAAFAYRTREGETIHHVARTPDGATGLIEYPDELAQWPARDAVTGFPTAAAGVALLDHRLADAAERPRALLLLRFEDAAPAAVRTAAARRLAALAGRELGPGSSWIGAREGMIALVPAAAWTVRQIERFADAVLDCLARPIATATGIARLRAQVAVVAVDDGDAASVILVAEQRLQAASVAPDPRGALASPIGAAIEAGQIAIVLQPQFAVSDGRLVGVEALARWNHPADGRVGAAALFAAAAREDCVAALSAHVQARAIACLKDWPPALAPLHLSVNVTAEDLATGSFAERIMAAAGDHARRIVLEITEAALILDLAGVAAQLATLRQAGFRIAIDDFGTGYSSLSYLKALPLDLLKLDQGLTADLASGGRGGIVARSVIAMARKLALGVVLEGIETQEQLRLASEQGADYWQGFLRSEPLDPAEFIAFALRAD